MQPGRLFFAAPRSRHDRRRRHVPGASRLRRAASDRAAHVTFDHTDLRAELGPYLRRARRFRSEAVRPVRRRLRRAAQRLDDARRDRGGQRRRPRRRDRRRLPPRRRRSTTSGRKACAPRPPISAPAIRRARSTIAISTFIAAISPGCAIRPSLIEAPGAFDPADRADARPRRRREHLDAGCRRERRGTDQGHARPRRAGQLERGRGPRGGLQAARRRAST